MLFRISLLVLIASFLCFSLNAEVIEGDVCVYGGTSGGVTAAVQAARMGKSVILLEPGRHLGGMTSGGLSAVDIGNPKSVGGITREYFTRLAGSYGRELAWDKKLKGVPTGGAFAVEPHTAERLFDAFVKEAGVVVRFEQRLATVKKDGPRIHEITMDDGTIIRARVYLDTTYEGDLMSAAGVSYTVTREANTQYGETLNGIQFTKGYTPKVEWGVPGPNGRRQDGKGLWDRDIPLDPYVIKGNASSGLLPLIDPGPVGEIGSEAPGVQAYCYRLCLTNVPENRIEIDRPADYDVTRYELVARFIEACVAAGDDMDLRWFSKYDPIPNGKFDFNTATFGGNLPGASWPWPEANWKERQEIAADHESWHRGLLWFLGHDPRVPKKVRTETRAFGLCRDEFLDTGGWPHQIYVREGRRMISDLVMTESHCRSQQVAPKAIALGSYGMDLHEIRRVVHDGVVWREGKLGAGVPKPYPIGYDAIVPRKSECDNLFVTFALSASHIAFGSIRMEPPFMVSSQSAATAACLVIDSDVAVQELPYARLRSQLDADGQIVEWRDERTAGFPPLNPLIGIIVDDEEAEFTGAWSLSNAQPAMAGKAYHHDGNQDRGDKSARFTPSIPKAGTYEVRILGWGFPNRSTKTKIIVHHADGQSDFTINQREHPVTEGEVTAVGTFRFEAGKGGSIVISNEGADGFVNADGVQLIPTSAAP
ncbi:MAG: FAD-dependent oxidoreductase [Verrucomicrobiae bacterium]|nr:FAD-dependent oxidoreductase [Verrucomicrobiae bacterium]